MAKVEGRNPVIEVLNGNRKVEKVLILKSAQGQVIDKIYSLARNQNVALERVTKGKLNDLAKSHAHQGVIAFAEDLDYYYLDDLITQAKSQSDNPFFVLLDEIKDPHNFGSILRTAEAAGVDGVIIPKRRAVGFTPVVVKTSAGAVEYLPVAQVTNLARTIEQLKEEGFWIAGADLEAKQSCYQADLGGSLGLVIGSEGSGMRRLVKEKCDFLIKMPMEGQIESLNASVAAGILIYESLRQRNEEG
ncbi:23S rRNA (guanosine(2251)-2'-O)-methyltransferase RlmB [Halanaerobacter jeridensis]|uniref:23S rRNA (Guanosine2251-2'-O)-methyltransferase n=1 Tax=Halanaerobacter jeridensis TaxID=706427 RepID=A0A938XU76_9FIRM|nr:23S rRNA (guanosine(2251)-2'-O)-methyltransferase RlmB [Halanaerobacter jeridensis]MBM7557851.1 23S rRNA (guanosine2251-2'-O)-methyltransferase [Halanaerobacter jeridensis]